MTREFLRAVALTYFGQCRFTIWPSVVFDVKDEKERELAAEWFAETVLEVLRGDPVSAVVGR